MTMTMLGLSQRLPFPGKRALRRDVAAADARSIASAAEEVANRVARDVRIAYADLQLAVASRDVVRETLATVRQLGEIAGHRYAVGQVPQSDVLRAQIEAVRLQQDLLRWEQAVSARRADLRRLVGGREDAGPLVPTAAHLLALSADPDQLFEQADVTRPSLKALEALITRSERALELAHRDYYPDFDVRLGYGLRERTLGGAPRDDMVTLTVAVNLPLWRKSRLDPRVAEAIAMRRQARSAAESQRLEIRSLLSQQIGAEQQLREAVILYRRTLRPQTQAAFEAAVAAYRVGRVDFLTLLDARVRVLETGLGEADAMAGQNKAVAEIQFLTGLTTSATALEGQLP
jgi:outer membrane protein TolC